MERPNPVKGLADALRDCIEPPGREERAERLAQSLQACFNEATQAGIREVREVEKRVDARLDKQDDTLRLIWKQVKGNGRLPIDPADQEYIKIGKKLKATTIYRSGETEPEYRPDASEVRICGKDGAIRLEFRQRSWKT